MSPRTSSQTQNQARLVRCSAGCGALVWLAGALPTTSDTTFVCEVCTKAAEAGFATEREPRPGETCSCGQPAIVVFITARFGDVPSCKR